uniref:Uncharacterized protein n=1 Tax=Magallana gigas TaxID=29159 RepID=K1PN77_MAGGI
MALVLQEGDTGDMVRTPPNFPTCGSFQTSKEQIEKAISVYKKILIAREAGSSFEFKELVSTGDGDYRMVYAINGQIPGPEIVVTEGDVVSM